MSVTINHPNPAEAHAVRVVAGRIGAGVIGVRYVLPRPLGQTLYGAPDGEAVRTILTTLGTTAGDVAAIDGLWGAELRRTMDGARVATIEHGLDAQAVNAELAILRRQGWRPERGA